MTTAPAARAAAFLVYYLLHDGETQQRLSDLRELARFYGVPWADVERAARRLGVRKGYRDASEDIKGYRFWKLAH